MRLMSSASTPSKNVEKTDVTYDDLLTLTRLQQEQITELKHKVAWFERQLFGRKSEKRLIESSEQGDLLAGEAKPPAPVERESVTYQRRKSRKRRDEDCVTDAGLRFDASVPIEIIEIRAAEIDTDVPAERISEKVTYRLAQRPGSYVILKYVRPVLKQDGALVTAPAPANVLEKSFADVSFLAGLLVDKFCFHLPLYRQHQRLVQAGITVSRGTLTELGKRAIALLEPIVDAQREHILQSRVLAMDETPIKAGRKQKGQMRQAYFWPVYGEDDEIVFSYAPSRAAAHVPAILGENFHGTLVTDGFAGYEKYVAKAADCTHAACWAHSRRYFEQALTAEPEAAGEALELIGELYRFERLIREKKLTGQNKLEYRSQHSLPAVRTFWDWCYQQRQRVDLLPSNPLAKALGYVWERREALEVYLSDPDVPIDTNHLERALRPIPMGRKNFLFCWTELGAKHVGLVQSLLVTCRLHSVHPYTYLVDVLQRISQHPARDVIELTPRVWKTLFANDPIKSDLETLRS
jgi:transposase